MPRLALCHMCNTITRLPDPPASAPLVPARIAWIEDGKEVEHIFRDEAGAPMMVAKYDPALEDWMTRHEHPDVPERVHKHDLWRTDQATWNATDVVATVKKELKENQGRAYVERDELKDDAMRCFKDHGRPSETCSDVFSEAKTIGGHESNAHMAPNERMYLCHACPFVHGYVIPKTRDAQGLSNPSAMSKVQQVRMRQRRHRRR